jgi:flap endonuclease-1
MGCDYCETIKGIGPKRAIDLIKEHKSIDKIIEKIDKDKYPLPENWLYKEARELFLKPDVTDGATLDLNWNPPDEEGIVKYMCEEKGFK